MPGICEYAVLPVDARLALLAEVQAELAAVEAEVDTAYPPGQPPGYRIMNANSARTCGACRRQRGGRCDRYTRRVHSRASCDDWRGL